MMKVLVKQRKTFLQYAIILFLLLSFITLFLNLFLQYNIDKAKKVELLNNEQKLISTENTIISNKINKISSDLLYVADCFRLNDNENGDYTEVEKQWMAFSNRRKIYDQIRYIDENGNEIVRVNYSNNRAILVNKNDLQNKKDRYYFTDTIKLKENQIYISKLDLNIENNIIEEPFKPMIRISTPYYDSNGKFKGIIILNYLADDMLNQIRQAASTSNGNIYMLNSDGYWLYDSKNSDNEWTFMYKDKVNISFSNKYPIEWNNIKSNNEGYNITDNGVFIYSNIITSKAFRQDRDEFSFVLGSGDWTLLSFMSADLANGILFTKSPGIMFLQIIHEHFYLYIFIFAISLIIAGLVAINKNEREKIKYFSEYDEMTGVYNRRAGFQKLSELYKNMVNKSCVISICFIDINGLKEVNDALGHEAGDELILSVISGIKQNINKNDFVARLGGDEFLIIFEGLNESQSEGIWKSIVNEYTRINEIENRKYIISVSHGIESFQPDSNQYIDVIMNKADEKMYSEKRQIKKNFKVLRDC